MAGVKSTKDGNYKGNTMMVHMPDIEIKVSGGMAETEKNRFEETPREMEVVFERGKGETEDGKRDNPNRESFEIGDEIKGKKIVGIQRIIHGPLFPNRSIVSRIALKGPRGGKYYGEVYRNGKISIQNGDYGYFEGEKTLAGSRENPVTFIETSDNTLDFGEITPAIARKIRRQSGKIRLTKEGLDHVKSHEDEIKDVGFESIIKFIEAVIRKFDAIYEDRGALFLAIKNKPSKMAVVRLDRFRNGDFYVIKTALPVRSDYLEKKKLLWDTAQSNHRNNATPGAISGHNSFDTKNTKKSAQRENPADMLAGLPYIENPGPELRENKGVPPEDIYDMITDNIISVIESDEELPWQKRYGTGFEHGRATNFVSKNAYRGINWVMLNHFRWIKEDGKKKLVRGRFSTPYFLTFNQVDDLDGSIKEGAVAQRAFFFSLLYSYEQSDPDLEFSSFDRKEFIAWLSEHSSQITGLVANEQSIKKFADQSVIPIVKYYNLFNGEDIEGIDFGGDYDDQKLSDADKLKTAELIFDSYPNKPPVKHGQQQPSTTERRILSICLNSAPMRSRNITTLRYFMSLCIPPATKTDWIGSLAKSLAMISMRLRNW